MASVQVSTWVTPPQLGFGSWTPDEIIECVSSLPRDGATVALCSFLSAMDIDSSAEAAVEAQLLNPQIRDRIRGLPSSSRERITVFHPRQLLLVLALLAKYGDRRIPGLSLGEGDAFRLGEICLQVSTLANKGYDDELYDDWHHSPIASRARTAQELALNAWFSATPTNGFLSVLRAHRILFHHMPIAEAALSNRLRPIMELFEQKHGVSCEKAFALLGTLCQTRYSTSREKSKPCHLDISSLWTNNQWTPDEIDSIQRAFVKDLDGLAKALPDDVLADPLGVFRVITATPVIKLPGHSWWSHGPILSELLLRSFYAALRDCASDQKLRGRFDNAFGRAVELYVMELFELAKNAAPASVANSLNTMPAKQKSDWIERKPEFEVGLGTVRQLIEVKSRYFPPAGLFGQGWYKSIEEHLFSQEKGLGQLACCTVARCSGLLAPAPSRVQSLLVVLEALPTHIPGIQFEARSIFAAHLESYASLLPNGFRDCPPKFASVTVIPLEDLEPILALTTLGYEFKDLLDSIYSRQGEQDFLPMRIILDEIWHAAPAPPTYDWLRPAYDGLYSLYDRVFGPFSAKALGQ